MSNTKIRRSATILLLIALSAVALLAFVSTFPAALYAAEQIHLPSVAAITWALIPDAATLVGMLGALVLNDRKGRRFSVATVATFATASGLVNVAHALSDAYERSPVALLVAYGLVATVALFLSAEVASRVVASLVPVEASVSVVEPPKEPKPAPTPIGPRKSDKEIARKAERLADRYRTSGRRLTVSALQSELHIGFDRAKRVYESLSESATAA